MHKRQTTLGGVNKLIRRWLRNRDVDSRVWRVDDQIIARISTTRNHLLITLSYEDTES